MMKKIFTIIIILLLNLISRSQIFKQMTNNLELSNNTFLFDNEFSKIYIQNLMQPIVEKQTFLKNIIGFEINTFKKSGFTIVMSHYQTPKHVFNQQNISLSYSYKIIFTKNLLLTPTISICYRTEKYSNYGLIYPSMQTFIPNQIKIEKSILSDKDYFAFASGFKLGNKNNNFTIKINDFGIVDNYKNASFFANFQKMVFKTNEYRTFLSIYGYYFYNIIELGLMSKIIISNVDFQVGISYNKSIFSNFEYFFSTQIQFENISMLFSYANVTKSNNNGVFEIGIYFNLKRKDKSY